MRTAVLLMFTLLGVAHAEAPTAARLFTAQVSTLDGTRATLASVRRQRTVIDVWGSFCKPCVAELPYFEALRKKYAGDSTITFVSLNVDDWAQVADVRALVQRVGLKAPVFVDADGELAQLLGNVFAGENEAPADGRDGVPQLVVIDNRDHVWREVGGKIGGTEADYLKKRGAFIDHAR